MSTTTHSSQAGLASFTPITYPRVIFAAVIEWGDDESPSLILARSDAERLEELRRVTGDEWPEATISEEFQSEAHINNGSFWISLYEAEV